MNDDPLGTLGEMMDAFGRAANAALKHIVVMAEAALPLLLPPKDLRLTMGDGSVTGILLVENNRIVAGLVIHHSASPGSVVTPPPRDPSPAYSTRGRFDDDDEDCRLPGWADSGHRGSPPWGR